MKNILDLFAEKTGLKLDEDFCYAQCGGTGYCEITVIKNNKLMSIGEFSYNAFIRNEHNDLRDKTSIAIMEKFLELAILFMEGKSDKKPTTLWGNYWFNIRDYKKLIQMDELTLQAEDRYFKQLNHKE